MYSEERINTIIAFIESGEPVTTQQQRDWVANFVVFKVDKRSRYLAKRNVECGNERVYTLTDLSKTHVLVSQEELFEAISEAHMGQQDMLLCGRHGRAAN